MKLKHFIIICSLVLLLSYSSFGQGKNSIFTAALQADLKKPSALVMDSSKLQKYVEKFNTDDEELYANISNDDALSFLEKNIPLFECPDKDFGTRSNG
jgi:hypothetical protein